MESQADFQAKTKPKTFPIELPSSGIVLGAAVPDNEGAAVTSALRDAISKLLNSVFDICIVDDNRTGEIVLRHQCCQMAKFDPLDCARVTGGGCNPRKGRDQILKRSVAEP